MIATLEKRSHIEDMLQNQTGFQLKEPHLGVLVGRLLRYPFNWGMVTGILVNGMNMAGNEYEIHLFYANDDGYTDVFVLTLNDERLEII